MASPGVPPLKYLLTPSLYRLPVSGKCAFRPLEKEKLNGRPSAPASALLVLRSLRIPPGWLSTKSVASTTKPSTTHQNSPLDPPLCAALILTLLYGLAQPVYTCLAHWERLTETERLRMQGMVVSGAIGAVFLLESGARDTSCCIWCLQIPSPA